MKLLIPLFVACSVLFTGLAVVWHDRRVDRALPQDVGPVCDVSGCGRRAAINAFHGSGRAPMLRCKEHLGRWQRGAIDVEALERPR